MARGDEPLPTVTAEVLNYIDGAYRKGSEGKSFVNIDPATGKEIGRVYEASREDVDAAVQAAKRALKGP